MTKITLTRIAASIALAFSCGTVSADALPPVSAIGFDADGPGGPGGGATLSVVTLDWDVASNLVQPGFGEPNDNPVPPDPSLSQSLNVLTHAALRGVIKSDSKPAKPAGLNTLYEITLVAGACVHATPIGSAQVGGTASSIALTLDPACGGTTSPDEKNFFEIWYDKFGDSIGAQADALNGTGYRDGRLIARGFVVDIPSGAVNITGSSFELFDQFVTDNYGGKITAIFEGSQSFTVLVQDFDPGFFTKWLTKGSLASYTNQTRVPYVETDPSKQFYSGATPPAVKTEISLSPDVSTLDGTLLGGINGVAGPWTELQTDGSNQFRVIPLDLACRVTGGGKDTAGIGEFEWDLTVARGNQPVKNPNSTQDDPYWVYTFGGQAGANTAKQPQPKGQWVHQNHEGKNKLEFDFKIGTASAPKGTKIEKITCTDEGWCQQARPAPDKQIDFVGTGTFTHVKNLDTAAIDGLHTFPGIEKIIVVPQNPNSGIKPTYHWFQVHIEDLGEPGKDAKGGNLDKQEGKTDVDDPVLCPPKGSGNDPFATPPVTNMKANCDCADFYHIRIYKGFFPVLDASNNIVNQGDINKTDLIYEVWGYIDGGNFQIHPQTGFDMK